MMYFIYDGTCIVSSARYHVTVFLSGDHLHNTNVALTPLVLDQPGCTIYPIPDLNWTNMTEDFRKIAYCTLF